MTRHESRSTPKIVSQLLYTDDAFTGTLVGSSAWFTWLSTATTFFYESPLGTFTAFGDFSGILHGQDRVLKPFLKRQK